MAKKLEITLTRSLIGRPEDQRVTVNTLGLRKMHQTVVQADLRKFFNNSLLRRRPVKEVRTWQRCMSKKVTL